LRGAVGGKRREKLLLQSDEHEPELQAVLPDGESGVVECLNGLVSEILYRVAVETP
jgi:hypothetical protein